MTDLKSQVTGKINEAEKGYLDGYPVNIDWPKVLKHYHSVELNSNIDNNTLSQIMTWCNLSIGCDHFATIGTGKYQRFWFERKTDCLMFRLRWSELCLR